MGSDLYLAWPSAEIAVMGAEGRRRDPAPAASARGRGRARGGRTRSASSTRTWPPTAGFVDAVIDPADTRPRGGLPPSRLLATKRETLTSRKHDNSPVVTPV